MQEVLAFIKHLDTKGNLFTIALTFPIIVLELNLKKQEDGV